MTPISIRATSPTPPSVYHSPYLYGADVIQGDPTLGQNEFTMVGGGLPFTIPCVIGVEGADSWAMQQLLPVASWRMTRSLPNALPPLMPNGSGGSDLYPRFNSDGVNDPYPVRQGLGFSLLSGLPSSNSVFGARSVEHKMQGSIIATSNIEVFYAASQYSHPPDGSGTIFWCDDSTNQHHMADNTLPVRTPNWFYYYNQAYTLSVPVCFTTRGRSYYNSGNINKGGTILGDNYVHIGSDAHGHYSTRLWRSVSGYASPLVIIGYQDTWGIDTFASIVFHERTHKVCYTAIRSGMTDKDLDGMPDIWEPSYGLDPTRIDTTGFGAAYPADYSHIADQDVYCQIQQEDVTGNREADWADTGLNFGTTPGPIVRNPKTYYQSPLYPPT